MREGGEGGAYLRDTTVYVATNSLIVRKDLWTVFHPFPSGKLRTPLLSVSILACCLSCIVFT